MSDETRGEGIRNHKPISRFKRNDKYKEIKTSFFCFVLWDHERVILFPVFKLYIWRRVIQQKQYQRHSVLGEQNADRMHPSSAMAAAASPSWKLYQNPHYSDSHHDSSHQLPAYESPCSHPSAPPSDPVMDDLALARAEMGQLRTEIGELRAQLEIERRMRQDAESLAKAIAQELAEESRARDEAEAEADRCREAANRAFMEAEEDRRMLKLAEAWREERVQMKLAEAAIVLEERLREIAENAVPKNGDIDYIPAVAGAGTVKGRVGREKQAREAENPHIKRGIKGFVEFSRASKVRSPGSARERERAGGNFECQKAQLKVLMRQRNAVDLSVVVSDAQSIATS